VPYDKYIIIPAREFPERELDNAGMAACCKNIARRRQSIRWGVFGLGEHQSPIRTAFG